MFYFVRREVFIASIFSAVLVNLVITKCFLHGGHLFPFTKREVVDQVRIQFCVALFGKGLVSSNKLPNIKKA
jgi:hypothetical protein